MKEDKDKEKDNNKKEESHNKFLYETVKGLKVLGKENS